MWATSPTLIVCILTKLFQFDLKFTKGNTAVNPAKLIFLQKKYAESYIEENGAKFEKMVNDVMLNATVSSHNGLEEYVYNLMIVPISSL